ncbi:hypothetical protein SporoP17a_04815 [Sporosarcina ureae]|nr:hypothetical protein SporoP17a_04815 [Sporosarcina ureae]
MDKNDEIVGFAISYIIIIMFQITNIYIYLSVKIQLLLAKWLATISFIGFMFLITPVAKLIPKSKK